VFPPFFPSLRSNSFGTTGKDQLLFGMTAAELLRLTSLPTRSYFSRSTSAEDGQLGYSAGEAPPPLACSVLGPCVRAARSEPFSLPLVSLSLFSPRPYDTRRTVSPPKQVFVVPALRPFSTRGLPLFSVSSRWRFSSLVQGGGRRASIRS